MMRWWWWSNDCKYWDNNNRTRTRGWREKKDEHARMPGIDIVPPPRKIPQALRKVRAEKVPRCELSLYIARKVARVYSPSKTALFFPFLPSHRFIYRCIVGEMKLSCFGFGVSAFFWGVFCFLVNRDNVSRIRRMFCIGRSAFTWLHSCYTYTHSLGFLALCAFPVPCSAFYCHRYMNTTRSKNSPSVEHSIFVSSSSSFLSWLSWYFER